MASSRFSDKVETLLEAVRSGNLLVFKKVASVLNESKIKGIKDKMGLSALHLGAFYGRTEICLYLIQDLGFPVDFLTARGETPLCYAAMKGRIATARYLISCGANPIVSEKDGITPLHYAAQCGNKKKIGFFLIDKINLDFSARLHENMSKLLKHLWMVYNWTPPTKRYRRLAAILEDDSSIEILPDERVPEIHDLEDEDESDIDLLDSD